MLVKFQKMHGLGNDFMMIDGITQSISLTAEKIRELSDRHFGVGFDQLLLVEVPDVSDVDFTYRIYNADGGEVENCGNGARCFARFVYDQKLTGKRVIRVQTHSGIMTLSLKENNEVRVDMGEAILEPNDIPFKAERLQPSYDIRIPYMDTIKTIKVGAVSMGNPHIVLTVDDILTADVDHLGPLLENHELFPQRVNVGFMQVVSRSQIKLRVYERGSGETLACGTGACAAVVAGQEQGLLDESVKVDLSGGTLSIKHESGQPVIMTGPCVNVYEGWVTL
jgi:diaminopimelate epimerase